MLSKPFAAFGWVIFMTTENAGVSRITPLGEGGRYPPGYYFYTKGSVLSTNNNTGEQYPIQTPGYFNLERGQLTHEQTDLTTTYLEDTEWVCIDRRHNGDKLPALSSLVINAEESATALQGYNLFLARGIAQITDKLFTGPCQIHIRSGDVEIKAIEKCYILRFIK